MLLILNKDRRLALVESIEPESGVEMNDMIYREGEQILVKQ
jgi:hypothetical protein